MTTIGLISNGFRDYAFLQYVKYQSPTPSFRNNPYQKVCDDRPTTNGQSAIWIPSLEMLSYIPGSESLMPYVGILLLSEINMHKFTV